MDLGEKLLILSEIIYENAKKELMVAEAPLSLQAIVIDAVAAKFKKEAYKEHIIREIQSEQMDEVREGTPEDLLKEIGGDLG